ncbi:Uncharacterised protein [Streptococcus pneumoniae]|nr:Uncharacterised protein [Streptococcus pneumoniae]
MPFAPSIPLSKSAICMDPPLPLHNPVAFPKSSAIIPFKSQPFAIQCPCPLCVLVILSLSVKWAHTPTATASSPAYKWTKPGRTPCANNSCTLSSNLRISNIFSYIQRACSFVIPFPLLSVVFNMFSPPIFLFIFYIASTVPISNP